MAGSPVVEGAVPGGFAAAPHDNLRGMSSWVLPDKTLEVRLGGEREGVASHPITDADSRSRSVSVSPPQRFASAPHEGDDAARPSGAAGESGSDSGPEWVAFQDVAGASGEQGIDTGAVRSAFAPCDGEEDWEDGEPPPHTVSPCLSPSVSPPPLSLSLSVCVCVCARVYVCVRLSLSLSPFLGALHVHWLRTSHVERARGAFYMNGTTASHCLPVRMRIKSAEGGVFKSNCAAQPR